MEESKMIELPNKPRGRAPFAVQLLQPQREDRILNVGCYDGALEFYFLRDKVEEFFGIDLNQNAIDKARSWSKVCLKKDDLFQVASAEKIPFPDNYFSKVLCLDVFEHVDDEQKVVSEIFRVLKPGGRLILSVPHDFLNFLDPDELTRGVRNIVRRYIKKKPQLTHPKHRHYSETELKNFFHQFEFDKVHKSGTPFFWILSMLYTAVGLPDRIVNKLSKATAPIENWDYKKSLPTGFNIIVRAIKPKNN